MKFKALALASAVALSGFAAVNASAQDRDVTITHETPNGSLVTKHVERSDGLDGPVMHRTVRVERPDGSTLVRRTTRWTHRDVYVAPTRTVVIHRRYEPMRHVVVRTVRHRPDYVINRHVTVIRDAG